jgi:hypothetical protein
VVVPRGQLGRILAWTESGAHAARHPSPDRPGLGG